MKHLLLVVSLAVLVVTQSYAASVIYDLSLDPGLFDVQVVQNLNSPLPKFTGFQSSATATIVTEGYAYDRRNDSDLNVEILPTERAVVRATLDEVDIATGNAEVVIGALYNDLDCLKFDGDRLVFSRQTNIPDIYIMLPADYAVIYSDQAASIEYNREGRVVLHINNPEMKMITPTVVGHHFWGEPQLLDKAVKDATLVR